MPCYRPIPAYRNAEGRVVFSELKKHGQTLRPFEVPCGQCIGCRLERSRQWAIRGDHEAKSHILNCFATLTYRDESLPVRGQLDYPAVQKFLKRTRKAKGPFRYMCAGEYGDNFSRPHYHIIFFGLDFGDRKKIRTLDSGCDVYESAELNKLWPHGYHSLGGVTFESIAYVARYCVKKVTGRGADSHYARSDEFGDYQQIPEFLHCSTNPAIGKNHVLKHVEQIYEFDSVVARGHESKPPRYYDKILKRADEYHYDWIKAQRENSIDVTDSTAERLAVKEEVTAAQLNQYPRGLS